MPFPRCRLVPRCSSGSPAIRNFAICMFLARQCQAEDLADEILKIARRQQPRQQEKARSRRQSDNASSASAARVIPNSDSHGPPLLARLYRKWAGDAHRLLQVNSSYYTDCGDDPLEFVRPAVGIFESLATADARHTLTSSVTCGARAGAASPRHGRDPPCRSAGRMVSPAANPWHRVALARPHRTASPSSRSLIPGNREFWCRDRCP